MLWNIFVTMLGLVLVSYVTGHGRLMDPPNRSSIWRLPEFQYLDPPQNYDDNALYCGGFAVQHDQNGGNCGECGDPYQLPRPRDNEIGGLYYRNIIVRNYTEGQVIPTDVELTASHLGYFEFRLCTLSEPDPNGMETQACFDKNLLRMKDGSTQFPIPGTTGHYYPSLQLPSGLTCQHCVLQWTYTAGNNWGTCENGTGALGCGAQETFRGCADISIS